MTIILICPNCNGKYKVSDKPERIVCEHCGYIIEIPDTIYGNDEDTNFILRRLENILNVRR